MPGFRTSASAFVLCALIVSHGPAWGQADSKPAPSESREAREKALALFRQSEDAYQKGQFDEAARLLEQAYALHQEPVLLYNLARAYEGMGELEQAVAAYKRYIEGSPKAKDRGAIERRIETLEKQIRDQKQLDEEKKRLAEERTREKKTEPAPAREPAPASERPRGGPGIWPWVTAGAGVAVLGAGVVVGLMSQSKRDDADADPVHASSRETFRDAESLATTANVLFVTGGVLMLGGVTWILVSTPSKTEHATLELRVAASSVRLQGSF